MEGGVKFKLTIWFSLQTNTFKFGLFDVFTFDKLLSQHTNEIKPVFCLTFRLK